MDDLTDILLLHANRYPLLQPIDAVKLVFQNECGPGHLIADPVKALAALKKECSTIPAISSPRCDPLGNGLCRVDLRLLRQYDITPDELFSWFFQTAEQHHGDKNRLSRKLDLLSQLTQAGKLPFDFQELSQFLTQYRAAGMPAVSHSPDYRNAYFPVYRVVYERLLPDVLLHA